MEDRDESTKLVVIDVPGSSRLTNFLHSFRREKIRFFRPESRLGRRQRYAFWGLFCSWSGRHMASGVGGWNSLKKARPPIGQTGSCGIHNPAHPLERCGFPSILARFQGDKFKSSLSDEDKLRQIVREVVRCFLIVTVVALELLLNPYSMADYSLVVLFHLIAPH